MGVLLLTGCVLVAYSVPTVVFFALVVHRPQLLVTCISAAFAWLLSFVLTSFLWSLITALHTDELSWAVIILTTVVQEIARLLFIKAYLHTSLSFRAVALHALLFPLTDLWAAMAAGVGFALMQISVIYAPVFAWSIEPGALFTAECPAMSTFTQSALTGSLLGILQIASFILALDAFRRTKPIKLAFAYAFNLAAAIIVSDTATPSASSYAQPPSQSVTHSLSCPLSLCDSVRDVHAVRLVYDLGVAAVRGGGRCCPARLPDRTAARVRESQAGVVTVTAGRLSLHSERHLSLVA